MITLPLLLTVALQQTAGAGAFVVRLGTDTLSLEQYTRTATQLRGEYVIRSPRSLHRIYTADLNPDGSIRRFELVTHNISGGPGPAETRLSVEFSGDSAVMTTPRGDSSVTQRRQVPPGTLPFTIHVYGLVEQIGRAARASGKDSTPITVLASADQTSGGYVKKLGGDTLLLTFHEGQLAGLGPFTFRLDAEGNLAWLTGKGSTVQVDVERVASVPIAQAGPDFASRPLGTLSVRDTARATISFATVWVDYGRPLRRGREIFGNVVPWNRVWRTGANAATKFNTSHDLVIGGVVVPAGMYTLWTIPTPTGATLIINKQHGQWGTVYNPANDLVRVNLKTEQLREPVEQLTIAFEPPEPARGKGSVLRIDWDRTRYSVPVSRK
jgi:hypothetical protein